MATKQNPGLFSCYERAMDDEPIFELLARDPSFSKFVRAWADEREAAVKCGDRPQTDMMQVGEARACAEEGEKWRRDNLYRWRERPVQDVLAAAAAAD